MTGPTHPLQLDFRPLTAEDLGSIHLLHSDPTTNLHNPFGPSPDQAASATLLAEWLEHWRRHGFGYELMFDSAGLAGVCGARYDNWRGQTVVNLYWRVLPRTWHRGYGTAAGVHALEAARSLPGGNAIVARMTEDNTASQHIAESIGLTRAADLDGEFAGARWLVYSDR